MDILQTLYEFFKDLIVYGRSRSATQKAWEHYLEVQIEESKKFGGDWVGASHSADSDSYSDFYLLNTFEAFVPMSLAIDANHRESLRTALQNHPKLVVLGEPGAGKSTLTTFITLLLAEGLHEPTRWRDRLDEEMGGDPLLPVRIELYRCRDRSLRDLLLDSGQGRPSREEFENRLRSGPVFLLFDGLDEITDTARRFSATQEIVDLSAHYLALDSRSRFMVMARRSGYNHKVLGGGGFAQRGLEGLEPEQQVRMIRNYYSLWGAAPPHVREAATEGMSPAQHAEDKANALIEELKDNSTLRRLTVSPLLLALISFQYFQGRGLPSKRHELYRLCVHQLVTRRDQDDVSDGEIARRLDLLGEVALVMLDQPNQSSTSAQLEELFQSLSPHYHGLMTTQDFLAKAEKEWGMLSSYTSSGATKPTYIFCNTSFQEYLAARIINRAHDRHWSILRSHLADPDWWEVVLLYTAIPVSLHNPYPIDEVVTQLLHLSTAFGDEERLWLAIGRIISHESNHHHAPSEYHKRAVEQLFFLAAVSPEALGVFGQIDPEGPEYCVQRAVGVLGEIPKSRLILQLTHESIKPDARQHLRDILLDALNRRPSIKERLDLARALGKLGEPRQALIDINVINSGIAPFSIMKYPVTNGEYARFVNVTGYHAPRHWQSGVCDYPSDRANYPVTNVTFHDAEHYCRWLTSVTGVVYRLPTDAEWLWAAFGNRADIRYPWGNEMDTDALNCMIKYGGITPVGIFLEGESESGVSDLMGNVWEWTSHKIIKKHRLRGGDYNMYEILPVRELERFEDPEFSDGTIGFRAVAAL